MSNTIGLREPDQMNWDNHNPGSTFQAPPPALDAAGNAIVYKAVLPKELGSPAAMGVTDEGFQSFEAGPLVLRGNNNKADGYEIRFYTVNVKKFKNKKTGEPMEVSSASKLIRAAGSTARPQRNAEYAAAMKAIAGRNVQLTIEWKAKDKQTGEEVKGFENFPDDPDHQGQKKAILKRGDVLPDGRTVQAEVLFANAQVRYIIDPNRK